MDAQDYENLEDQLIQLAKEIARINELLEKISESGQMQRLEMELANLNKNKNE